MRNELLSYVNHKQVIRVLATQVVENDSYDIMFVTSQAYTQAYTARVKKILN